MTDLALGWTDMDVSLPDPLHLQDKGPICLITAPKYQADTPRQRLTLLQACFDAGIDLVPLSPDQRLHSDEIGPGPPDLQNQLARMRGCGQLSLTLSWQTATAVPQSSGQSWLRLRQRERNVAEGLANAAERALLTLAAGLPHRRSKLRPAVARCSLDLLVRRDALGATQARISALSPGLVLETLPAPELLVTGLWPPFSFVQAMHDQEVHA